MLISEKLKKNLLSGSKLTDVGAEVFFGKGKAVVRRNKEVVLEAKKVDGLYVVNNFQRKNSMAGLAEEVDKFRTWKGADIKLWHRRLGHASEEVLKKKFSLKSELSPCEYCLRGKFDRKPFLRIKIGKNQY